MAKVVINQDINWAKTRGPKGTKLMEMRDFIENLLEERTPFEPRFGRGLPRMMKKVLGRENARIEKWPQHLAKYRNAAGLLLIGGVGLISMIESIGWNDEARKMSGLLQGVMIESQDPRYRNKIVGLPEMTTVTSIGQFALA